MVRESASGMTRARPTFQKLNWNRMVCRATFGKMSFTDWVASSWKV
jgi:hypothetical protein